MPLRDFIESDSEQIYFEFWGDSGPVVILGHGLGGNHAVWYQQVAFLSQHYRVITWDQRGFGNSTRSTGVIGPAPAVEDLARVLEHLEVERAHVIGQSMGGWSALGFAIDHPERVISLVLADTTAGIFTPAIRQTLADYGKGIVSGLYQFSNGGINAFLVDDGDAGLTLIDSGYPKDAEAITKGIHGIDRDLSDLTNIVITHAHPDHLGSAKQLSGGTTPISLHPEDADIAKAGVYLLTMKPGPGILNAVVFRLVMRKKPSEFPAFEPDIDLKDGDVIDVAGGIEVIHTPGHTPGHVALLWRRDGGLLFVGDAAANLVGLNYMIGYDDVPEGKASLTKLSGFDFEAAVFGHGKPILSGASDKFSKKFA
jgi:glyoxylase-like metal-dependent hydrolase (beta-lactamase superfamily II)